MLKKLTIDNFRGFQHLELGPLDRVNLIAAKNNGGKTALLEALRVLWHPDDPRVVAKLYRERGFLSMFSRVGYEEMWTWLFHQRHIDKPAVITANDEQGANRLRLRLLQLSQPVKVNLSESEAQSRSTDEDQLPLRDLSIELEMAYEASVQSFGQVTKARRSPKGGLDVVYDRPALPKGPVMVLIGTSPELSGPVVSMFSTLAKRKAEQPVIEAARKVEKRLRRLSVQVLGNRPMLHADLGGQELIPLRLMGDGFQRLIEVLIAAFYLQDGLLLIDEIENGLHFSVLPDLWTAIREATRQTNVQVFATTHSYDCIRTAHNAFIQEEPYGLRLHRLEYDEAGQVVGKTYDRDTLDASLEMLLEVR